MQKNYLNFIQSLERQASNDFNSFHNYGGRNYGYGNAAGDPVGEQKINDFDRTLTITATTVSSTAVGTAYIFGAMLDDTETTNTSNNVAVTIAELGGGTSSHPKLKRSISARPFRIVGGVLTTTTAAQLNTKVMTVWEETVTGTSTKRIYQPASRKTARDQVTTQADLLDLKMKVGYGTYLVYPLLAAETVTLTLWISDKVDPDSVLDGESVRSANTSAPPPVANNRASLGQW